MTSLAWFWQYTGNVPLVVWQAVALLNSGLRTHCISNLNVIHLIKLSKLENCSVQTSDWPLTTIKILTDRFNSFSFNSKEGKHLQVLLSNGFKKRGLLASQATTNNNLPLKGITVCATVLYKLSPITGRFLWRCQDHSVFCLSLSLSFSLLTWIPTAALCWGASEQSNVFSDNTIWRLKALAPSVTSFYGSFFIGHFSYLE